VDCTFNRKRRRNMGKSAVIPADKIGAMLTYEKYLSDEELESALESQTEYRQVSIPSRLGEVLVDSKTCPATVVSRALHRQRDRQVKSNTIGQVLLELGYVTKPQLEKVMEAHMDVLAPFGEILIDNGICNQEQVQKALHIQLMRRVAAIRRPLSSSFDPINIMELLAEESIDDVIEEEKGCHCDQCRANVLAIALNGLAPRYISDMQTLVGEIETFRLEYGVLVQERICKAVQQVKMHPKLSCKISDRREGGIVLGKVTARISNRHVHLAGEHVEQLFGPGYTLDNWKDLIQPGQYAAKETVTLLGSKGAIERVRVLGPPRSESQVEISGTDQFKLGVHAPVRESGQLEDTPGIELVGPYGSVALERGVIRAWRHIHMTPEDGSRFSVRNRSLVHVRLLGDRTTMLEDVLVRITDTSALEMHIDTDEANAAGVAQESDGEIIAPD
jgi:propanediol utilization protein